MIPTEPADHAPFLTRRHYTWLALVYGFVIIYGSLVPLQFQPLTLDEALRRFGSVCDQPVRLDSLADWAANVLLFIPFGYLLMAALTSDRSWAIVLSAPLLVVPSCTLLSASLEFTQLFVPQRVSSLNDIVAETSGGLIGVLLWLGLGRQLTAWARGRGRGLTAAAFPIELLVGYLLVLTMLHLLPFDLTLSPRELWHKYRDGRVRPVPFFPWLGGFETLQKQLHQIAFYAPVGLILAGFPGRRWRAPSGWPWVLLAGFGLAGFIEFGQLFVVGRVSDAADVLGGALGVLLGWLLGRTARLFEPDQRRGPDRGWLAVCLLGWAAAQAYLNWHPFDFQPSLGAAAQRLAALSLVPFADYWAGDYLKALDQAAVRILLYVPVGVLLPLVLRWENRGGVGPWVVLLAAAWAAVVEVGQLFVPSRYASVTDVLVAAIGTSLGYLCCRRLRCAGGRDARPAASWAGDTPQEQQPDGFLGQRPFS